MPAPTHGGEGDGVHNSTFEDYFNSRLRPFDETRVDVNGNGISDHYPHKVGMSGVQNEIEVLWGDYTRHLQHSRPLAFYPFVAD